MYEQKNGNRFSASNKNLRASLIIPVLLSTIMENQYHESTLTFYDPQLLCYRNKIIEIQLLKLPKFTLVTSLKLMCRKNIK